MAYATPDDLATFTSQAAPADAARLLQRASELIDNATVQRAALCTAQSDLNALRDACCAQVEFWLQVGESHAITKPRGWVMTGSSRYEVFDQLAPRAKAFLSQRGLLYRGVGMA
jgi:hypothetical protein